MQEEEIEDGSGGRAPLATTQNRRRRTHAHLELLIVSWSEQAGDYFFLCDYWYWFLPRATVRVSAAVSL
jgi:hypothetical protein